ncbi:MAG: DNA-3-methyladenine glycosylase I [Deltaproteobacteria bacterium HGW-Deltaproteobacteria-23]|nr:MAG: DNA-3-methyladenine glycosylase I [Deltaproteobacteria bacterium HGW-Deltaproteobacteria-23]
MNTMDKIRCGWAASDPLYRLYHDTEWGVPTHDDRRLFEFLILEGAQAGLSWITILKKRDAYRLAFSNFDPEAIAAFDDAKVIDLMSNNGIVRNRLKIASTITNARAFLEVQKEFGSFESYIWSFTGGKTVQNSWEKLADVPASSAEAERMSRELKKLGFRFVGPTICYAFMQAIGMVNDHKLDCFRWAELANRAA